MRQMPVHAVWDGGLPPKYRRQYGLTSSWARPKRNADMRRRNKRLEEAALDDGEVIQVVNTMEEICAREGEGDCLRQEVKEEVKEEGDDGGAGLVDVEMMDDGLEEDEADHMPEDSDGLKEDEADRVPGFMELKPKASMLVSKASAKPKKIVATSKASAKSKKIVATAKAVETSVCNWDHVLFAPHPRFNRQHFPESSGKCCQVSPCVCRHHFEFNLKMDGPHPQQV